MTFDSFLHKIPQIKQAPLLAEQAHRLMAPVERLDYLRVSEQQILNSRKSAVLMLFYPKDNKTHLVLIERASYKGVHSSQIALPGGKWELDDSNLEQTALRETQEEIGVDASEIEIIKTFTQIYIPPSNFLVAPFMGIIKSEPIFIPDHKEVAQVIEVPIETLLCHKVIQNVTRTTSYAKDWQVPAYVFDKYKVWGATAMMLSELRETLFLICNPSTP